ncbi:MAG: PQQ-dependent sugar dehydrogenase [Alphaproteobacteria bacterium]|nr:PQQ-dependent sugar dehydrogenase [Alphaproteobacteria bacterium]
MTRRPELGRLAARLWPAGALALLAAAGPATAREEHPGERFSFSADELPSPREQSSPFNPPQVVPRGTDEVPVVPAGFVASVFADDLDHPRAMALAPNGDVLLAESDAGKVTLLRDGDHDGRAETRATFAVGLNRPHGIVVEKDAVYIADQLAVWRFPYRAGAERGGARAPVTERGALSPPGGYWTRALAFAPDGGHFYVAIGSRRNVDEEAPPRATVQRFARDGSGQETLASGLRNPVGMAFYPGTDDLYVTVNERDRLGDALVPDYLTRIEPGDFFGWPYAYIGGHPDPDFGDKAPEMVAAAKRPDVLFEAHSTPIGLVFYDKAAFPEEYRGDAFVSLRGSWNAAEPTGYKVVRVKFENGRPAGWYDNFATGFRVGGTDKAAVWGRPAGLLVLDDGSLLVADDTSKTVFRVRYVGP